MLGKILTQISLNPCIGEPVQTIKRLQKMWGSLSDKSTVTLNTVLIRAPKECLDYVVTHELYHKKYHDHSPESYKLLAVVNPPREKAQTRTQHDGGEFKKWMNDFIC